MDRSQFAGKRLKIVTREEGWIHRGRCLDADDYFCHLHDEVSGREFYFNWEAIAKLEVLEEEAHV